MTKDRTFAEFKAYWQIADELLGKATKEQLSECASTLVVYVSTKTKDSEWVS